MSATATAMTHEERAERRAAMAAEVKEGADPGRVARRYGVGISTVKMACLENGLRFAGRPMFGNKALAVIADLKKYEGKKSQSEIANKHKLSRQRVNEIKVKAEKAGLL